MEFYSDRLCPVCGKNHVKTLLKHKFDAILNSALLSGYDVVSCKICGAVFSNRIPPSNKFKEYYASSSKYEFSHRGGEQYQEEINRVTSLARWIASNLSKKSSILDIGCATGELLLKLRGEGFTDLTGMDPSSECVERVRSLHNIPMIEGVLSHRPSENRKYDIIILSAVLEHIPNINEFMLDLISWININGYLIIEVPDLEFFTDSHNAPFQELSVEHVNFFTEASLNNMLGKYGFNIDNSRHYLANIAPGGLTGAAVTVMAQLRRNTFEYSYEHTSEKSMIEYIALSNQLLVNERIKTEKVILDHEPTIVWGTGTLCQRLLAQGNLASANITAFVDSNPHYHNKLLSGRKVISPSEISTQDRILIASWGFEDEIRNTIKSLGLKNKIITLR